MWGEWNAHTVQGHHVVAAVALALAVVAILILALPPPSPSSLSLLRGRSCRDCGHLILVVADVEVFFVASLLRRCCGLGYTPERRTELACWRDRRLSVGAKRAAQRQEAGGETVASRGNRTVAPRKLMKGGSRTEGRPRLEEQGTREGGGGGDRGIHTKEVREEQHRIEGTTIS